MTDPSVEARARLGAALKQADHVESVSCEVRLNDLRAILSELDRREEGRPSPTLDISPSPECLAELERLRQAPVANAGRLLVGSSEEAPRPTLERDGIVTICRDHLVSKGRSEAIADAILSLLSGGEGRGAPAPAGPSGPGSTQLRRQSDTSSAPEAYQPQAIHFEEADTLEYVAVDIPTISRQISDGLDLLLDLEGRQPVGWRIYGWSRIAPDAPSPPLDEPESAAGAWRPTHRHVKRGSLYRLTSQALLQTERPAPDETHLLIYQDERGLLWARPSAEFYDGRFEPFPALAERDAEGLAPELGGGKPTQAEGEAERQSQPKGEEREDIARIIDPSAWRPDSDTRGVYEKGLIAQRRAHRRKIALAKADAILSRGGAK